MGRHRKLPSEKYGRCHFSVPLREHACACFKDSHFDACGYNLKSIRDYESDAAGRVKDTVWESAYQSFIRGLPSKQRIPCPRNTSYKNYYDLVNKWYDSWDEGESCARGSKGSDRVPLEVLYRIARLVAEGVEGEEGSWVYFEDINEACERVPELRLILSEYSLRPATVFNLLVRKHKLVLFNRPDERDRHARSTLEKRQMCSQIWAGTRPWRTITSPTRSAAPLHINFEWDWYSHFTFMIDAIIFEDSVPAKAPRSQRVFTLNDTTYPPHLLPPKPRIDSTNRAMFYVVLHPHEGVVLGPDLVYTGSKVSEALKGKKDEMLKDWCACCDACRLFKTAYMFYSCLKVGHMCRCWLDLLEGTEQLALLNAQACYRHIEKKHYLVRPCYQTTSWWHLDCLLQSQMLAEH